MKKILLAILVIVLIFSFGACTSSKTNDSALQKRIEELEEENQQLRNQISTLQGISIADKTEEKENASPKTIELNKTFSVGEIMNITLNSSEWCEKILPSNTNGVYSYISDNEGEKFFVVHGKLENLASETVNIRYASEAELLINGKYKMPAIIEMEENDGTSFHGGAKPLQTLNIIVYASVSDELYEQWNEIQLSIDIINTEENLGHYYDDDYSHDSYVITFKK